ncbi:MAG: heme ABC exporter ATP-binding protein CcmA [Devosia nanyangense]|uniref:Heme ABC exporter ATP-binding protein CcmA n=1 Tax=Devosia nanyangense TaxID=1228055 RepID=A0A933L3H1_9HYPH|nr:heme ABC exporter ATP-binding protein CcmA [Devosia nanyangense]
MAAMNAPEALLTVTDLALSRGERQLFSGLGFAVSAGELLLIRGPNGAGKSSLLLTLAGILRLDRGTIGWAGGDERAPLHLLGHLSGIKPRLTLSENLVFWRAVNGPTGLAPEAALDATGLGGLGVIEAGHLSAGQTRRLALARLLVTERTIWLLDEPTASLDTAGDALVGRMIENHLQSGGAVVAATHSDLAVAGAARTLTLGGAR